MPAGEGARPLLPLRSRSEMKSIVRWAALLVVLATAAAVLPIRSADGGGVGVNPGKLYLELESGSLTLATVTVINTGDRLFSYQVYVEGGEQDCFEFTPAAFQLFPDETRQVEVKALSSAAAGGERVVDICVVSLDPSGELGVGAGVKVKAYLTLAEARRSGIPAWVWALIAGVAAAAVVLSAVLLWYRRRRALSL